MKKIIGVILTLIAVNSFAGKIPEAKSLHPDLYTIQFTFVSLPTRDDVMMGEEEKRIMDEYVNLLEELEGEEEREEADCIYERNMRKAVINKIESLEGKYTELATIYTSSGEPFPEEYSNVKGLLDVESNTLVIFGYNFSKYLRQENESTITKFCVNEWYAGGRCGGKINGYLLIKCYPPTNLPSKSSKRE